MAKNNYKAALTVLLSVLMLTSSIRAQDIDDVVEEEEIDMNDERDLSVRQPNPQDHVLASISQLQTQLDWAFQSIERQRERQLASQQMGSQPSVKRRPGPAHSFVHFGKRSPQHAFVHIGKRNADDSFEAAEKRQPTHFFVHFGKRAPRTHSFVRIGRDNLNLDSEQEEKEGINKRNYFVRFGRSMDAVENTEDGASPSLNEAVDGDLDDADMDRVRKNYLTRVYPGPYYKRYRGIRNGRLPAVFFLRRETGNDENRPSQTDSSRQVVIPNRNSRPRYG